MAEKRVRRTRSADRSEIIASTGRRGGGGVEATIARRRGETNTKPAKQVIKFIGSGGDDEPFTDMLRAMRPATQRFREGNNIHVSDLISKCIRKIALMNRLGLNHPLEVIQDGRGVTFAIGDAIHDYVKARMRDGHPDKVWAKWACKCGKSHHTGVYQEIKGKLCPGCGGQINNHHEVSLVDTDFNLVGNPDLEFLLPEYDAFLISEIKSMSAEKWKELARPVPDHVVQVTFYWYLKKKLGFRVMDRVSIIYVNKEFSFKSPYKEFCFKPSMDLLQPYLDDLDLLKAALDGGELPPRVMCRKMDSPDAKQCPVCATCFGLSE